MLNEKEITAILQVVVNAFRESAPKYAQDATRVKMKGKHNRFFDQEKEDTIPEYFPAYKVAVDFHERIKIHSELGYYPEKLLKMATPNQTPDEAAYVKNNYKQVTLPFFNEYVSTISRCFSDPNSGVKYTESDSNEKSPGAGFKEYVQSQIKDYVSIENFIQYFLPAIKTKDPNGVVCIKPNEIYTVTDAVSGETIEDNTQLDTPRPYYYSSRQVVAIEEGEYVMVELTQKSMVDYGNQKVRIGKMYEFYDDQNIWLITQIGKFNDFKFDFQIYYKHAWGKVPFQRLKGVPCVYAEDLLWMSPLHYVTDILDLVLINSVTLQLTTKSCAFPYRVMYGDVCEFRTTTPEGEQITCDNGELRNGAGVSTGTCKTCNGSGLKSRISPLGVLLLRPPARNEDNEGKLTQKPIDYVSPDTAILDFLIHKIDNDYAKAQRILHLNANDSHVKNQGSAAQASALTATEVATDLKALYAFVKNISDQFFDHYQFLLDGIGWMRYGNDYESFRATVKYPTTFDFANESDYIVQLGEASNLNLPPVVMYAIVYRLMHAIYQDDKASGDAFKLIVQTDRLLLLSTDELQSKLASKTISKWEEILHTSAPMFIAEMISGNPDFFKQTMDVQQAALIDTAKKKAEEVDKATTDNSAAGKIADILSKVGSGAPPKVPIDLKSVSDNGL